METLITQQQLIKELSVIKKEPLVKTIRDLNLPFAHNLLKEKHVSDLAKYVLAQIEEKRGSLSPQTIIANICTRIKIQEVSKLLKKLFLKPGESTHQTSRQPIPVGKRSLPVIENQKDHLKCLCNNTESGEVVECGDCGLGFHVDCLRIPKNQRFECPYCFAVSMDPLNEVKSVLFAGYMRHDSRQHRIVFQYQPTLEMQKLQPEIRCFRLDRYNNYSITYPDIGDLRFNDAKILDFKPLAENSSLKKRKDEIKVIEKKLLRNNNSIVVNEAYVHNNDSKGLRIGRYNHFIMVCLVKSYTNRELFQRISTSEAYLSKKGIHNVGLEAEIEMEKVYVELKCPLSFQKIKVPIKGRECVHDACVDLESMILFNKSSNRLWKCPICRKKIHRIVVNEILYSIIKNNPSLNLVGVTFYLDGSFDLVEESPSESLSDSEPEKAKGPIVISIDDSDSEPLIQTSQPNPLAVVDKSPSSDDNELNRPIPLNDPPELIVHQIDSSDNPPSWEMDSFHHDAGMRLELCNGDFQDFDNYDRRLVGDEQKEMELEELPPSDKDYERGLEIEQPPRQNVQEQPPSRDNEGELMVEQIVDERNSPGSEEKKELSMIHYENKLVNEGSLRENPGYDSSEVILIDTPRREITELSAISKPRPSPPMQLLAGNPKSTKSSSMPRRNPPLPKNNSVKPPIVIEILDSDEEDERGLNSKYCRTERMELQACAEENEFSGTALLLSNIFDKASARLLRNCD